MLGFLSSSTSLTRLEPALNGQPVIEGIFAIDIGFEHYVLEKGDSALFPSSLPHR